MEVGETRGAAPSFTRVNSGSVLFLLYPCTVQVAGLREALSAHLCGPSSLLVPANRVL